MGRIVLLGTNVVSMGEYPNTEDRSARVTIRNVGNGDLRVARIVTTCTCMRVDAFPATLAPGASGDVSVSIKKNEVSGAFQRVFFIESNDPSNRLMRIQLEGFARPVFLVTCDAHTVLGPVEAGLVWTGRYSVVATEAGVSLGAPTLQCRGATCAYTVRTNLQERVRYEVIQTVTFEGAGNLESVLTFPILGKEGQEVPPVRLSVEASRHIPLKVVPDRLAVFASPSPVSRRLLVFVNADGGLDVKRFKWEASADGIEVRPSPAKSGKAFAVELIFSPAAVAALIEKKGGSVSFFYEGGFHVVVPVAAER